MKFVYILEKDPRFIEEILEALQKIDPKLEARIFPELDSFAKWIQLLAVDGSKAIAKGGIKPSDFVGLKAAQFIDAENPEASGSSSSGEVDQLALLISDNGILGSKHMGLLRKTQEMFIQKNLCTKEDPTAIVITAFDNHEFDIKAVEDRIINNVLYKPFDKMILIQHLIFAISGRHPPSDNTLHNMKTSATIEMLKDVEVEAFSETGFITLSSRALPVGAVSKYYSDLLASGKTRSAFARCALSEPHATEKNIFRSVFNFFAVEPEQHVSFKKNIPSSASTEYEGHWRLQQPVTAVHLVMIDPEESGPSPLSGTFERAFSNVKVVTYKSMTEFLTDLDPSVQVTGEKPVPAFPGSLPTRLQFDITSKKLLKITPELPAGGVLLGFSAAQIQGSELFHWMLEQQRNKVLSLMKGTISPTDEKVLIFKNGEQDFYLQFESREGTEIDGQTLVELTFQEMTEADRHKWLINKSRMPEKVDGILVSESFVKEEDLSRWTFIGDLLKKRVRAEDQAQYKPEYIILAKQRKKDPTLRALGKVFSNIFYKPVERNYFIKMMYLQFPALNPTDPIEIKQLHRREKFEVGNPIQVTEISEAGLVMTYYRPITVGTFRRFILWVPIEIGHPVMMASCNFTKENEADKSFENHFVFFGTQDNFLHHVRIWIRDNYVLSKQSEGS